MFNRNGDYKDHIKELSRKGRIAARKIWGLGERVCRNDFKRRWMLFRYLVESVMCYGVEIWGWEEKPELEKVMMDYMRWIFKLDFCTPRYIISRELRMNRLKLGWGIRAVRFEERVRNREEGSLIGRCWKEKEINEKEDRYSKERQSYYNKLGWELGELEDVRRNEENLEEQIILREQASLRTWEENKINEARYNKRYKDIDIRERGPKYLHRDNLDEISRGEDVRALIKFRCGILEEVNKYWLNKVDWKCVFCENGEDCLKHYVEECVKTKDWFAKLGSVKTEVYSELCNEELGSVKGEILKKLWKERDKKIK